MVVIKQTLTKIKPYLHYKRWTFWLVMLFLVYNIVGFLVVPWVIKSTLQSTLGERLNMAAEVEKVFLNPYALSLNIEQLSIQKADGSEFAGFDQFYVNVQTSSLFRWALTFRNVHLLGLRGRFERFDDHQTNFSKLADVWQSTAPPDDEAPADTADEQDTATPRLLIQDLQLSIATWGVIDHVPASSFEIDIGPVSLSAVELSTLPKYTSQQLLTVKFDNDASLSWSGELNLSPFTSTGELTLEGPYVNLVTNYLRDQLHFRLDRSHLEIGLEYRLWTDEHHELNASVRNLDIHLTDLAVVQTDDQNPLLSLDALLLDDIELDWPQQRLLIPTIDIQGGQLWAMRDANQQINLTELVVTEDNTTGSEASAPEPGNGDQEDEPSAWAVQNDSLTLRNWAFHFHDQSLQTPADLTLHLNELRINNIGTAAEQNVTSSAKLSLADGDVNLDAKTQLFPLENILVNYQLNNIPLPLLQPYLEEFALIELRSGQLNVNGNLQAQTLEQLRATTALDIQNLHIQEKGTDLELLGWQKLAIDTIDYRQSDAQLKLGKISLDQLFVDFAIEKDGSTTVNRILTQNEPETAEAVPADEDVDQDNESPAAPEDDPLAVSIAQININNTSANFADQSLPLPFATKIHKLNGTISTLSTTSTSPSNIDIKGQIEDYGLALISGSLTANDPTAFSDVELQFKNVKMPDLTPYTVKFAGRAIEQGKMDLDLKYKIKDQQLDATNKVVLYRLKLGEKDEQSEGTNLPLDLAIALLKDGEGKIDLSLPISGNLDDPNFSYASVAGQAFTKVITGIVTSPFKLLGKLAGNENLDLGHILFQAGQAELTPPEVEKLHQITDALQQRPELKLSIPTTHLTEVDRLALQQQSLEKKLEEALGKDFLAQGRDSKDLIKQLEKMYRQADLTPELDTLEQQAMIIQDEKSVFDPLKYSDLLTSALQARETVDNSALEALGAARQQSMIQALISHNEKVINQVSPSGAGKAKPVDGWVQVSLELKAD